MACNCKKKTPPVVKSPCRFSKTTGKPWNAGFICSVWRCYNVDKMLADPPEWAYGGTRRATVDDSPKGAVIEDADYIAVRSCFCRCGKCPHYTND